MTTLLHIDSSVRATTNTNPSHNSISKNIAAHFVDAWQTKRPHDKYIYRDVGTTPPQYINQDWIGAVFTPTQKRTTQQRALLAQSDLFISELEQADIIVISSPMYNYGMPAQLKAWFDQVIRVNKTFDFDLQRGDFPLQPLLSGKTLVIVTSCGEFGFEVGGVREQSAHLVPHIKTLSKYLGASTVYEITSEYQEFSDTRHQQSLHRAITKAKTLGLQLASLLPNIQ